MRWRGEAGEKMQIDPQPARTGPVEESSRITSLDLVRGVAVLGILLMNVVSFRYGQVPYWNISAGGVNTGLDWAIAVFGEIFIDQKFMGMFSLLFGAGIMLFIDRAAGRERRPVLLNLWRNLLLLGIGVLHYQLWEGDVLMLYAGASVFLLALRGLSAKALIALGSCVQLLPVGGYVAAQLAADGFDLSLAGIWTDPGEEIRDPIGLAMLFAYVASGTGMILLGAGLYRLGFIQGTCLPGTYRLTAIWGLGIGLPLAAMGVAFVAWSGFSSEVAFIGQIPNHLGTIPATLGYLSLVILWNKRGNNRLKARLTAAGRMALTNYLSQTLLGLGAVTLVLANAGLGRSGLLALVVCIWAVQLWWSQAWLARFRYGPAEWLWRVATYRSGQPFRRR